MGCVGNFQNENGERMSRLVSGMIAAARDSCDTLRAKISRVRWCGDGIAFDLDGAPYKAALRWRNRDLVIGHGETADKAVALRCILDGDATPIIRT